MNVDYRTGMIMQALGWAFIFISLLILIYAALKNSSEPEEKFKVVDHYEGCSVVRYTDRSNQWHYLLKCNP